MPTTEPTEDRLDAWCDGPAICVIAISKEGDPLDLSEQEVDAFIQRLKRCVSESNSPQPPGAEDQEFYEDFGARGPDDESLERMLEEARFGGDQTLRRLVKEVRHWRYLAPLLLDRIVPRGSPMDESDGLLKVARFSIRGEGGIGAKQPAG